MILEDFIVQTKTGLFCSYGNFYLDPKEPVVTAVISHAHGDHAVGGNQNVFCTKPTMAFMQHRYKKFAAANFFIKNYEAVFVLNGVAISLYPAGHMLGSSLVLMEYKGVRYLYTGDYKLEADDTCEPMAFVKADVLITETTFANPDTKHPEAIEEIKKLNETKSNIMLGAYALGKSQRLIAMINQHCTQKRILVHHSIVPFVKIYEELGIRLGKYEVYDRKVMKNNQVDLIYIVPPMVFHSYFKAINVVRIFATGWKHLQNNNEIQLYISDHVDWDAILETVEKVNPSEVWTTHGSGTHLQNYFGEKLVVKLLN
ncbi:MBL fold metallo-hydrolase [Pedobacter insulae]|uniref:Putative mRNA 3-end processing factor n=1 Tax=Pedobacter insulae TaxID=414048 RepID=A0A1I2UE56_9SPHI|nr:MBL fold metallo-hydrolase [Pedobacter insulae]SFG74669.1 putative mRNA 3-end processing factor [Pedobacter insulae]